MTTKAGLFHLQKDYKNSIIQYEKAFKLKQPDALDAYKAAGVYSLGKNTNKALYYLNLAINNGWTEAEWLSYDEYFDYLKKVSPVKWKEIETKAHKKEEQYELTLKISSLRKQINTLTLTDQKLRYKRIQTKDKAERNLLAKQIHIADSTNLVQAKDILENYGWPKISEAGKDGQNNFWLLVQHADNDVLFQQKALAEMEKLMNTTEINLENYAFLYDRVQCNLNYKQLYGTQVVWTTNGMASGFRPIIEENGVDERRKSLGLSSLKIYALTYGFTYNNVSAAEAQQKAALDVENTNLLINNAKNNFTLKEYKKVYDLYNEASTIAGGMSNEDNFEAALLFAKIAVINNEQQYKDIAVDFLNLLYLRQKLTKKEMDDSSEFAILHNESRWKYLYENIK